MKRRLWIGGMIAVLGCALVQAAIPPRSDLPASTAEVRKELIAVIDAQLAAFRRGEIAKAYGYTSSVIRRQNPLRVFAAIMEENYTEIWTNTGADFGLARDDGRRASLVVRVQGADRAESYDFHLIKERNGWQIEGILPREPGRMEKL